VTSVAELTIDLNDCANAEPAGWVVTAPFWMRGCCAAATVATATAIASPVTMTFNGVDMMRFYFPLRISIM
jgi:hypothetical protein